VSPLLAFLYVPLFESLFEPYFSPGNTYVYAVALLIGIFVLEISIVSIVLILGTIIFAFVLGERATFLNIVVGASIIILFSNKSSSKVYLFKRLVPALGLFMMIFFALPFINDFILNLFSEMRFDFTHQNIINFFKSILSSAPDLVGAGTRFHRLEMWSNIVGEWLSSPSTFFFGTGYVGNVALEIFRNPHNGFLTLIKRGGLINIVLYASFIIYLIRAIKETHGDKKTMAFGLASLGAFLGDAATGTIIDSPYTSCIFYAQIALILAYLERKTIVKNS